jgi:lipooligosaccharide transport system permease protein
MGVMLALGLFVSPWVIFAVPGAILVGLAFAAVGMAATTFMKTWQDFDLIQLVILPLFLFSGTFYPLDSVPVGLQWIGWISPLWHASELGRDLSYGTSGGWPWWSHLLVLLAMAGVGGVLARRTFVRRLRG